MSHTRSARKPDGTFSYECFDWSGKLFRSESGFTTAQAADSAANQAERQMMLGMRGDEPVMSTDEILAELDRMLPEVSPMTIPKPAASDEAKLPGPTPWKVQNNWDRILVYEANDVPILAFSHRQQDKLSDLVGWINASALQLAEQCAEIERLTKELHATVRKLNCDNAEQFWSRIAKMRDRAETAETQLAAANLKLASAREVIAPFSDLLQPSDDSFKDGDKVSVCFGRRGFSVEVTKLRMKHLRDARAWREKESGE